MSYCPLCPASSAVKSINSTSGSISVFACVGLGLAFMTDTFTGVTASFETLGFAGKLAQPISKIKVITENNRKINTPKSYLLLTIYFVIDYKKKRLIQTADLFLMDKTIIFFERRAP
ncbi:hypothetical protein METHB2_110074 [Candidatus Methylobacter favarea]|uniref:Uncharacterized protein n=1 Tax=Candidatus Methylobacter favarea TaxID=2707345 RepID=A0A8S0X6W4_9GAMM|nr:hypothetical protein METHB2_110074 [Candidatus Methylobacter favarea]